MPDLVLQTSMIARVRQAADLEYGTSADRFPDAEILGYVNSALRMLHGMLTQAYGPDYFMKEATIAVVSGTATYDLPVDFWMALDVELYDGSDFVRLRRWHPAELAGLRQAGAGGAGGTMSGIRYALRNKVGAPTTDQIELRPTPTGTGWSILLRYVQTFTPLAGPAMSVNGYNGWEEWAVIQAAIDCKSKQRQDASLLLEKLNRMTQQIEALADRRDEADGFHVVDVRGWEYD